MATKNRGEIAKLYALAKLISTGTVTMTDASLKPVGAVLSADSVQSGEGRSTAEEICWVADRAADSVEIRAESRVWRISRREVARRAEDLLEVMVSTEVGAISDSNPAITELQSLLGLRSLPKGGPGGDFNFTTMLGLYRASVQFNGGSDSSLINPAAGGSAFRYEILRYGSPPTQAEIGAMTGDEGSTVSAKIRGLYEKGFRLRFRETVKPTLSDNLNAMTPDGDEIISVLLLDRFTGGTLSMPLAPLCTRICEEERAKRYPVIRQMGRTAGERLEKLSAALRAIIFGFSHGATVSKPWLPTSFPGKPLRLIVSGDGKLLTPDPRDPSTDEAYLMNVCYFDNPSCKRFDYGYVYTKDKRAFIDLQLQMRMSTR